MTEKSQRLHEMLQGGEMVVAPFIFDAFQAKIAEAAGFQALYMTGFGTSAARGFPDMGLLTMPEMVANVRYISQAIKIPLICDADTGYGNPVNVWRTVQEYENAGASALHIEDQIWPKRCGFLSGKQVIPKAEMVAKVKAACDARQDQSFTIIARTDALAVNGWKDVVQRARAYRDAGADLIFVDGIKTLADMQAYVQHLGDLPLLYNGHLRSIEETAKYGFKLMINSSTLMAFYQQMRNIFEELKTQGELTVGADRLDSSQFEELNGLLGVPQMSALADQYKH